MPEETILKKDAVKLVKKRFRELLKPLGFQPYPHGTTRFMRVRENFIDEVRLDTWGYHLDADYYIYLRSAPNGGHERRGFCLAVVGTQQE